MMMMRWKVGYICVFGWLLVGGGGGGALMMKMMSFCLRVRFLPRMRIVFADYYFYEEMKSVGS